VLKIISKAFLLLIGYITIILFTSVYIIHHPYSVDERGCYLSKMSQYVAIVNDNLCDIIQHGI
jgi:hypothetical protein